jgi:hypothetical protein
VPTDDGQPRNPWGRLYRADIKSGFVYPVRASEVATALRATGAELGSLSFIVSRTEGRLSPTTPPGLLLLLADWQERRDMPYQGGGGELAIYAVPTARRAEIHELLIGEALPAAAHWLADAAKRGEVWRDMRHERWITLGDSGLSIEDREGGSWSTVRRA